MKFVSRLLVRLKISHIYTRLFAKGLTGFDNKIAWYENEGRSFPTLLDSYTGAAPGDWNRQYVILPTTLPATGNIQFQFLYTRGAGELGDLAIDDFCIF